MFVVYMLRSKGSPDQTYIRLTTDLKARVKAHNVGQSKHTAKYKPWDLVCAVAFDTEEKARQFEHYLKTGSGRHAQSPPGMVAVSNY